MSTVTTTASGASGTLTVQVPAGVSRLVQLVAVPAANSTAPYFAKTYSGSASVDVGEGETKSVTITLGLEETKIPLCSPGGAPFNWYLAAADSLTETPAIGTEVSLYFYSDIEYDEHGRLFVSSDNRGIQRFSSLTGTAETVLPNNGPPIGGLAYQKATGRLYFTYFLDEGTPALAYVDVASGQVHPIDLPANELILMSSIAVDDSAVYVGLGYVADMPLTLTIQKLIVGVEDAVSYGPTYSLDLPEESEFPLFVQDMTVQDGTVYVAANNMYLLAILLSIYNYGEIPPEALTSLLASGFSFGKIIALDAATLRYRAAIDWSSPPSLSSLPTDIYCGPLRFLGFARGKLYVADAGIQLAIQQNGQSPMVTLSAILGRIVEIGASPLSISRNGPGSSAMPLKWMMEITD